MRDAVIVAAVRTPVGRRNGMLAGIHPVDLSATVLRAIVERTGVDPVMVDDVVWGCVSQVGEQTFNIGRSAVLAAGWPESVPAVTLDRQCGSSQQAIAFAAAGLVAGQYDVVVAGGVESMSRVALGSSASVSGLPFGTTVVDRFADELAAAGTPVFNQGVGAELIAQRWGFSRTQLDEFALESHEKAAAAIDDGRFADQIVAVTTPDGGVVTVDEGVRRGGSLEALAGLKTPFLADGVITAASSSQISDGAAALLMMTSEAASGLGLTPTGPGPHDGGGGVGPGDDADRPDPGDGEGARPGRARDVRHRRGRGERGLRVGPAGLAGRDRRRRQAAQRPRRGHRVGAPAWRLRGAPGHDLGPSHGRVRTALRAADDVRGRRHGQRDDPGESHRPPRLGLINNPRAGLWITPRTLIASYPQKLSPVWKELHVCHSWVDPGQRQRVATANPARMKPNPMSTLNRAGMSFITGMLVPAR